MHSLAMLGLGALGGAINALLSHNLHLWPSVVAGGHGRLVRPGLALNVALGALAALEVSLAFRPEGAWVGQGSGVGLRPAVTGILVGMLASRWLSAEVDKRLLRAAVNKACQAPAAHPDTLQTIDVAPPHEVYAAADRLMPRHGQ